MKRDMELARNLLIQISEDSLRKDEWDEVTVYHLRMLDSVGYIEGIKFYKTFDGDRYALIDLQLTWSGHEFLETIRSKTVWERIKGLLKDKGVDLSVEAIKLAAPQALAAVIR